MSDQQITINRLTGVRVARAISRFARSEVGGKAAAWAFFLIALLFGINTLNVVNSYVGRDFMTAIEQQSMPGFVRNSTRYIAVFALLTFTAVFARFAEERLALLWREWLTARLSGLYLRDLTYYGLKERTLVDNPDQRIADDVRIFTTTTLSFVLMFLNASLTIIAFSGVLWSISPLLFGVAVAYAATGSAVTILFGRSLVGLSYRQSDREAAFRADLVHVRENAETIALSRHEQRLSDRAALRVKELADNARKIIGVNRNLGFFTTLYNYLIQILPALIVAPLFIRGQAEFGVIPQSAMAFTYLLGAFSLIVTQFQAISSYGATIVRLSVLAEAMENTVPPATSEIRIEELPPAGPAQRDARSGPSVTYERLTLRSPRQGLVLVDALDLVIADGARVLVTTADDTAGVALFRATAGIWDFGSGRIVRPAPDDILFVPERPYLPPGTLEHVLVRVARPDEAGRMTIEAALALLGVEGLVERTGGTQVERDWDTVLSLREQQLLAVASVLMATPRFVFLDRIMTTLTPDDIGKTFAALQSRSISYVTFGASNGMVSYCDATLSIGADGRWQWSERSEQLAPG